MKKYRIEYKILDWITAKILNGVLEIETKSEEEAHWLFMKELGKAQMGTAFISKIREIKE